LPLWGESRAVSDQGPEPAAMPPLYEADLCNRRDRHGESRTPLVKCFLAIYMMSQDKRGCSAKKLQRVLGIAYDTAWTMSHKICHAMGERDSLYLLSSTVELDDAFLGGT